MSKFSGFVLMLSLIFPLEKGSIYILLFFFALILIKFDWKKKLEWTKTLKIFFSHPLVLLFIFNLFLVRLRLPIQNPEKDLSLFFIPLIFSFYDFKKPIFISILKYYIIILFSFLVILIASELYYEFYENDFINHWKLQHHYNGDQVFYFFHSITERIKFHHIYLSSYLTLGVIIGGELITNNFLINNREKTTICFMMLCFAIAVFLFVARNSIICLLLYGLYILITKVVQTNKRNLIMIIASSIIILITIFCFSNVIQKKFYNIYKDGRVELFQKTILLIKSKPLFGYGSNLGKEKLINQQSEKPLRQRLTNPHNQYLNYAFFGGGVMLLVFVYALYLIIKSLIKHKNSFGILILVFFMIQFLTESYLERYRGVLIFSLFVCLSLRSNQWIGGGITHLQKK